MGISPRIRWGSIFPGREWRTGALLITMPFLCKGPRLTYKVRSRVTVICKFFMATLFQTCLLTDDTINQQFYKLMIIKLRGSFTFFQVTQGFYEALPGDTKNGSKRKPKVYDLVYISQLSGEKPWNRNRKITLENVNKTTFIIFCYFFIFVQMDILGTVNFLWGGGLVGFGGV